MKDLIAELNQRFATATPEEAISWFVSEYPETVSFSSSFGAEDQVITAMLAGINLHVRFFTLDTGRLFQETYDVMHITEQKYGIRFELFFPDAAKVEEMVKNYGINLFYESFENRRFCCHVRKIEPLKRALHEMKVWITGQRKDQSVTRSSADRVEWDEVNQVIKLNPLVNWSSEDVWAYIRLHKIPYNELHDKGYPSIGCQPSTRAILPGEDQRAGRWWWELPEFKECGLHKKS